MEGSGRGVRDFNKDFGGIRVGGCGGEGKEGVGVFIEGWRMEGLEGEGGFGMRKVVFGEDG